MGAVTCCSEFGLSQLSRRSTSTNRVEVDLKLLAGSHRKPFKWFEVMSNPCPWYEEQLLNGYSLYALNEESNTIQMMNIGQRASGKTIISNIMATPYQGGCMYITLEVGLGLFNQTIVIHDVVVDSELQTIRELEVRTPRYDYVLMTNLKGSMIWILSSHMTIPGHIMGRFLKKLNRLDYPTGKLRERQLGPRKSGKPPNIIRQLEKVKRDHLHQSK